MGNLKQTHSECDLNGFYLNWFNIKAKRATESVELSIDNISVKEFSTAKFLGILINKKIIVAEPQIDTVLNSKD